MYDAVELDDSLGVICEETMKKLTAVPTMANAGSGM
jgi:hypothetical protein